MASDQQVDQKLRFKDIIKHNIKAFGTTTGTWEQAAME